MDWFIGGNFNMVLNEKIWYKVIIVDYMYIIIG